MNVIGGIFHLILGALCLFCVGYFLRDLSECTGGLKKYGVIFIIINSLLFVVNVLLTLKYFTVI